MAYQEIATPHGVSAARQAISVLLVDDQRLVGAALERLLTSEPDIELHCCYNAIDAVAQWRFRPGTKDGKPVAVAIDVEVMFQYY